MTLPSPSPNQAYWNVSALDAGFIYSPEYPSQVNAASPSLSFLLQHSKKKNIKSLFDLGIRRDTQGYPTAVQDLLRSTIKVEVPQDVTESLRLGGIHPQDISYVFLSHLHYDSIGNPAAFPNATFLVGNEGVRLLEHGFPYNSASHFSATSLPPDRLIFLTPEDSLSWAPCGPFPRANDIYKDGSMYVIDAPGHLPGHINLLVRTSSRGSWVYLAGDSTHDPSILRGEEKMARYNKTVSIRGFAHADPEAAEVHLERVRKLVACADADTPVEVVLSHDREWALRNRAAFFPAGRVHAQYQ